jgi:hypothetical protein
MMGQRDPQNDVDDDLTMTVVMVMIMMMIMISLRIWWMIKAGLPAGGRDKMSIRGEDGSAFHGLTEPAQQASLRPLRVCNV